ncbi:O-antigen ligase family protein [Novosphingobium naphthalenivorans]|uniref:O-antigen ligase family protein n=1 Tax=Novosphingobium naphthalenivorans TaxID=273168 RepID=UPI00082EA577|nr:O-antigen ligase family protein [Novosphingobium naphthalenivorans]
MIRPARDLQPRAWATLAYLFLTLVLGGASAAGYAANFLLQVSGALLAGWSLLDRAEQRLGRLLGTALLLGVLLAVVQFLPLPPSLWTRMPGREAVAHGFDLLGEPRPWLTLSLAPLSSLGSLAWLIPAAALFLAMRAPGAPALRYVTGVVLVASAISLLLGMAQWMTGRFYVYEITNFGRGPGFFANSNHQSNLLLAAIVLGSALLLEQRQARDGRRTLSAIAIVALPAFYFAGLLINGSLACLGLLAPVTIALILIAHPDWRANRAVTVLAVALAILCLAIAAFGPFANDLGGDTAIAGLSRKDFLVKGLAIAGKFAPFGSGLGTLPTLYPWFEDPALVSATYVNHLHNDWLELIVETGLFGAAAMGVFVFWFARLAGRLWFCPATPPLMLAPPIVLAVELLHSLVDYPLRTAALAGLAATMVAIMSNEEQASSAAPAGKS